MIRNQSTAGCTVGQAVPKDEVVVGRERREDALRDIFVGETQGRRRAMLSEFRDERTKERLCGMAGSREGDGAGWRLLEHLNSVFGCGHRVDDINARASQCRPGIGECRRAAPTLRQGCREIRAAVLLPCGATGVTRSDSATAVTLPSAPSSRRISSWRSSIELLS